MNDDHRPDPDALLAQMRLADAVSKSGRLHIFLGMCPGVGKTYAMLQTARQRLKEGVDVLVGIVETHGRSETAVLLEGMHVLPRKKLEHRGFKLEEFDIDAVLGERDQERLGQIGTQRHKLKQPQRSTGNQQRKRRLTERRVCRQRKQGGLAVLGKQPGRVR